MPPCPRQYPVWSSMPAHHFTVDCVHRSTPWWGQDGQHLRLWCLDPARRSREHVSHVRRNRIVVLDHLLQCEHILRWVFFGRPLCCERVSGCSLSVSFYADGDTDSVLTSQSSLDPSPFLLAA